VGFTPYFIPRNGLGQICYTTKSNIGTIQTTTTELNDNIISRFPLRFIAKTDPIIKERYSILVRQYVQSIEAYTFYKIISELGSVQSILSQNQPGYVAGNIKSLSNPDEKILGYFETSSVSSKRIYFNYSDFQIDVPPPYFYECLSITLDFLDNTGTDFDWNERAYIYNLTVLDDFILEFHEEPIYIIVTGQCGDCTTFSSSIKPDFWVD